MTDAETRLGAPSPEQEFTLREFFGCTVIGWLASPVGTNRYAYAGDDPVNKSDVNGHDDTDDTGYDYSNDGWSDWSGYGGAGGLVIGTDSSYSSNAWDDTGSGDSYSSTSDSALGGASTLTIDDTLAGVSARGCTGGCAATTIIRTAGLVTLAEILGGGPENPFADSAAGYAIYSGYETIVGEAGGAVRGLDGGGGFSSTTNAAGGEVFTSKGNIVQSDFEGIVNSGLYKGDVNILTGVHGLPTGEMIPEASFYREDIGEFGHIPGVNIYNVPTMTPDEISALLNGPGTTIGAFCNSGACLAPFK